MSEPLPFVVFRALCEAMEQEGIKKKEKLGTWAGKTVAGTFEKKKSFECKDSHMFNKDHEYRKYHDDFEGQTHHVLIHKGVVTHHLMTSPVEKHEFDKRRPQRGTGGSHKNAADHVDAVASSGTSPVKMHELYHHVLKKGHVLVGTDQSPGGIHVWSQLQKMKGVNIHGWNPHKNQPVNVDLKHGTDETHVTHSDRHNSGEYGHDIDKAYDKGMHAEQGDMWLVAHHKTKGDE